MAPKPVGNQGKRIWTVMEKKDILIFQKEGNMETGDDFNEQEWEALRRTAREKKGRSHKTMKSFLKSLKSSR